MSVDINLVVFGGRLVEDPKDLGGKGCKIDLANNRMYKDNGETKKITTFMPIFCWGKLGKQVMKSCRKGDPVIVEGELEDRRFTGDDGQKKKIVGIKARDVRFVSTKAHEDTVENVPEEPAIPTEARDAINKLLGK